MTNFYLNRYGYPKILFEEPPHPDLNMVVVIPCFMERDVLESLNSLYKCSPTKLPVEILLIINEPEACDPKISDLNQRTFEESSRWAKEKNTEQRHFLIHYEKSLPTKHAGVGLARKIGMDEGVRRLEAVGNEKGIIVCFDADTTCGNNYLSVIERFFIQSEKVNAVSIEFEHPLTGHLSNSHYEGIVLYELFLRYYVNALRWAGYPFAYHCIGSSMAVRSDMYQKVGGMNKRKAGEDFYFLHKIIPFGNFEEIKQTTLVPSARDSTRVPFGTGKAIRKWLDSEKELKLAYAPETFIALRSFLMIAKNFYGKSLQEILDMCENCPEVINSFLEKENFSHEMQIILRDSGKAKNNFYKRFFTWFNAFRVLKYCHFSRDHFFPDIEIREAVQWLQGPLEGGTLQGSHPPPGMSRGNSNEYEMLMYMREIDREPWSGGLEWFRNLDPEKRSWP